LAFRLLLVRRLSSRLAGKEAAMMPDNAEQHSDSGVDKRKPDWVYIGSLVLIAISLLGMAYICWVRYGVER